MSTANREIGTQVCIFAGVKKQAGLQKGGVTKNCAAKSFALQDLSVLAISQGSIMQ